MWPVGTGPHSQLGHGGPGAGGTRGTGPLPAPRTPRLTHTPGTHDVGRCDWGLGQAAAVQKPRRRQRRRGRASEWQTALHCKRQHL